MSSVPLRIEIERLSANEHADLAAILELKEQSSPAEICERIRWMYWSRTRARFADTLEQSWTALRSKTGVRKRNDAGRENGYPIPSWDDLVKGLAEHLKVYDAAAANSVNELYISQALIVRALGAMSAAQRKVFFDQQADIDLSPGHDAPPDKRLAGPARTVAVLGLANAAGFSLYTASSAALGLVTHAVGITLPFAAFTGLSSTIAFMIGPPGWLAVGAYAFWKATSTNWEKLAPAIVYLINARAAKSLILM